MKFIPDEEIILLEDQDLLGTKIYADSLKEIIDQNKNNKNPLTIGLFGGWGTGKSSIVKTLLNSYENSKDIKVFYYNAWKYSEDAFRRSFILELVEKFDLKKEKLFSEIDDILYNTKNEDVEHKIVFNKKGWLNLIICLPLIVFFIWWTSYGIDMKVLISIFGIIVTIVTYLVKESFSEYKISVSSPRIFSPEQFSKSFISIINSVVVDPTKKLIIVIDNIDRCDIETAKEIMLTVKNFLDQENCIFIIPIDDEAIKNLLGFRNEEGEEYLRKFFNLNIRIKKFTKTDLFKYTKQLIRKHSLGFSDKIADIVSKVYSKNPRRIIQFLNNLYADKIVAENQESSGYIPKGGVTDNLEFLSKIIILKEECPNIYAKVIKMPSILNKVENYIQNNIYQFDKENDKYVANDPKLDTSDSIELSEDEFKFLNFTLAINSQNIDYFIRIKNHPIDISENTEEILTTQSWEKTKDVFSKNGDNIDGILDYLESKLEQDIIEKKLLTTSGLNDISLLLEIYNDKSIQEKRSRIRYILHSYLNNHKIIEICQFLNSINIISIAKDFYQDGNPNLVKYITRSIKAENMENNNLTKLILENFGNNLNILDELKSEFSKYITHKNHGFENFKDVILNKNQVNALISESTIDDVISKITNSNEEPNHIRVNFLKNLNSIEAFEESHFENYYSKINSFLNTNDKPQLALWFNNLIGFVIMLQKENRRIEDLFNILSKRFNDGLMDEYYNEPNNSTKFNANKYFIILMKEIFIASACEVDGLDFIKRYLKRYERPEINLEAVNCLIEIVDNSKLFNYDFINEVQMLYTKSQTDLKLKVIELLNKMLTNVEIKDDNYLGLSLPAIQNIFRAYLVDYLKNETQIKETLKISLIKFSKSEILKPILYEVIKDNVKDINQIEILDILLEIDDKEILEIFANNIITETRMENELNEILNYLEKYPINKFPIFKDKVINIANSTDNDDYRRVFFKVIFGDDKIFNDENKNMLLPKLIHFVTGNKNQVKFALDIYSKLENINEKNKKQIKSNFSNINTRNDKDLELLKENLQKKIK